MMSWRSDRGDLTAIVILVLVFVLYHKTLSTRRQWFDIVTTQSAFALSLGRTELVKYSLTI
jgi:hypothetical protein